MSQRICPFPSRLLGYSAGEKTSRHVWPVEIGPKAPPSQSPIRGSSPSPTVKECPTVSAHLLCGHRGKGLGAACWRDSCARRLASCNACVRVKPARRETHMPWHSGLHPPTSCPLNFASVGGLHGSNTRWRTQLQIRHLAPTGHTTAPPHCKATAVGAILRVCGARHGAKQRRKNTPHAPPQPCERPPRRLGW